MNNIMVTSKQLRRFLLLFIWLPLQTWAVDHPTNNSIPALLVTLPFNSAHTRVNVTAKVNGSKPYTFLLDTGYGIDMVHPDLIAPLGLKRAGRLTIIGIAGEERAGMYSGAVFDLGGQTYAPHRVASLPSEAERKWRRRDGILGADFFRRFVVEIDSAQKKLRLYDPEKFSYAGPGEIVPLQFRADTPIIDAAVDSPKNVLVRGRFEVDTGCDDDLCLGHDFVESNKLASADGNESAGVKRGVGGGAEVRHGQLPQLQIGRLKLDQPSANFFAEGSPAAEGLAGHIGMAALRHWKIIFDYQRQRMIFEEIKP